MEHHTFKRFGLPEGEPIEGKTYRADGWAYMDPPGVFTPECWDNLLDVFGKDNVIILSVSKGVTAEGEPWIRGQFLASPLGWANLEKVNRDNQGKVSN